MIIDVNAWIGSWPFRSLRDHTPEALVARMDRSGIDVAAVSPIEAIFHRNAQPANERLAEAVSPHRGRLVPLATLNPTYTRWEDDLKACHERLGMKGVRLFPAYQGFDVGGPLARRVAEACRERGLPIFIPHRMEDPRERHWMDPGRVVDAGGIASLIAAAPGVTVVVPNLRGVAGSPLWRRPEVRDQPWFADLSLGEVHRDLETFVAQGGASHLLFGTHLPLSYAGPALVKRALLPVDAETLEDISHRHAARILGL